MLQVNCRQALSAWVAPWLQTTCWGDSASGASAGAGVKGSPSRSAVWRAAASRSRSMPAAGL